jgi:glutathione synthase/RimK-type ligase-like ATP-grasp enzyme
LRIAPTWVSNDVALMRERLSAPTIAKPVAGGGLCHTLEDALQHVSVAYSAMPALIQPRLVAPELRVFVVGQEAFAFEVSSPSLDYRAEQDAEVTPVAVPDQAAALLNLMCDFRMDFGAADFKTDPHTGELIFLELNTSPMFAKFDMACDGVLAAAMVQHLIR